MYVFTSSQSTNFFKYYTKSLMFSLETLVIQQIYYMFIHLHLPHHHCPLL
jgi:hypothetical protein